MHQIVAYKEYADILCKFKLIILRLIYTLICQEKCSITVCPFTEDSPAAATKMDALKRKRSADDYLILTPPPPTPPSFARYRTVGEKNVFA